MSSAVEPMTVPEPRVSERVSRSERLFASPGAVRLLLALIVLLSSGATITGMRHTSPTFDEITTMTGGARGFETGRFDIMSNYPPVTQYLYGLPVYLTRPNYPTEVRQDTVPLRYRYAQDFLYRVGNDPERIVFLARLVAAATAALLILLTFGFTRSRFGVGAGLLAAGLVAFLPDVLAHGGVAYNDMPLAPAFLAALWGIDAALRAPSAARGALAGALVSIALGVKHSALALGPIAIVLLLMELVVRADARELRKWLPRIGLTLGAAIVVGYLVQVALYEGDFTLAYLRASTVQAQQHVLGGHGTAAYLLSRLSTQAPWYFYPVAFVYKTSVAMHLLMLLALAGAFLAARSATWRSLLAGYVRAPVVAFIIFGAILLRANVTIGFRYALPLLPIVCVLTAVGAVVLWRRATPLIRGLIVMLPIWAAASALVYHPHFLAYTSEYQPNPELGYEVLVDSSFDWGQGLLELRDFMRDENIDRVYLSYFGSALPEGYGIEYVSLPSFFPLPFHPDVTDAEKPKFVVISATNLVGLYINTEMFAKLRKQVPYKVLGHTMFVYEVAE